MSASVQGVSAVASLLTLALVVGLGIRCHRLQERKGARSRHEVNPVRMPGLEPLGVGTPWLP